MIPRALYRLADALELTLEWHGELGGERVRGRRSRRLELAGVTVQVPLEVVASVLLKGGATLLLKATGRLGLMVSHVDPEGLGLALLDPGARRSWPCGPIPPAVSFSGRALATQAI